MLVPIYPNETRRARAARHVSSNWRIRGRLPRITKYANVTIGLAVKYGDMDSTLNYKTFSVGCKVQKKSGKPFKSTFKVNTVESFIINPYTNKPAFTFVEDHSIVDFKQCELATDQPQWQNLE